MSTDNEQWIPMREAATILGVSYDKLARLVRKKSIRSQLDMLDERVKLVELSEVKRAFRLK